MASTADPDVEDVVPTSVLVQRKVKECYCRQYSSYYAGQITTAATFLFAILGFATGTVVLPIFSLCVGFVVSLLELPSLLQNSERLRQLATRLKLQTWAESSRVRGTVYLSTAIVGFLLAIIFGTSWALVGLFFLLERGVFYFTVPYCSGDVMGEESQGAVYDELANDFNDVSPVSSTNFMAGVSPVPMEVVPVTPGSQRRYEVGEEAPGGIIPASNIVDIESAAAPIRFDIEEDPLGIGMEDTPFDSVAASALDDEAPEL